MRSDPTRPEIVERRRLRAAVRWGLNPLLLAWVGGCVAWGLLHPEDLAVVLAVKAGVLVSLLLVLEQLVPYERRWGMTWRHLWRRDLVFIALNGGTLALLGWGLAALSIEVAARSQGVAASWPLAVQVGVGLLAFEAL
jgi:hypothetical protein